MKTSLIFLFFPNAKPSDDHQSNNAWSITHLSQILKPNLVWKGIMTVEYFELNIIKIWNKKEFLVF